MQLIKAPTLDQGMYPISLFLAGGISKCADWQATVSTKLLRYDITVFNPRRERMPKGKFEIAKQISWEFYRLRSARIVAFWFAPETLNPITLLELGAALARRETQKLIVSVHPDYERRFDVIVQCKLQHQEVNVGFEDFTTNLKKEIESHL